MAANAPAIIRRLKAIKPVIEELCKVCGAPGLSLGIYHHGEDIYYDNFGYRDVEARIAPDKNTVYSIGSLTKAFTAAACGILVAEGRLYWDDTVQNHIPQFQTVFDPVVGSRTTIRDLLCHRTGLARRNAMWIGADNVLLVKKEDTIKMCNIAELAKPFRQKFAYSNWNYCLAGEVIEQVSGLDYSEFLQEKLVKPLGLHRTVTDPSLIRDGNIALPYMALDDGSTVIIPKSSMMDGTVMVSAGGGRSCVKDLLSWGGALLRAAKPEFEDNIDSTPLKQISMIISNHVPIKIPAQTEHSYALGWVRTQLPGTLGLMSYNGVFTPKFPTIGDGTQHPLVIYHGGSTPGGTSSIHLLPETDSAIVVLTNSLGLCDAADWVGQLLIHVLLDLKSPPDYIQFARDAAQRNRDKFDIIEQELSSRRELGTSHRPLNEYTGRFWNAVHTVYLEVVESGGGLKFSINGLDSQAYGLVHYHYDTFSFHFSRDEQAKRALFTFANWKYWLLRFEGDGKEIKNLRWIHDGTVPQGEVFMKEGKL